MLIMPNQRCCTEFVRGRTAMAAPTRLRALCDCGLSIPRLLRGRPVPADSGAGTFAAARLFIRHSCRHQGHAMAPPASRRSDHRDAPTRADAAIGRRELIRGFAAGVAATPVLSAAPVSPPADAEDSDPRSVRYRETEHVRSFYRRARF
jgi:hypothetical protein